MNTVLRHSQPLLTMEVYDEYGRPVRLHALVALPTVNGGVAPKQPHIPERASVPLNDYAGEITRLLDRGDVSGKHPPRGGITSTASGY